MAAIFKKIRERAVDASGYENALWESINQRTRGALNASQMVDGLERRVNETFKGIIDAINREIVPVLKETTAEANRIGGDIQTKDAAYEVLASDRAVLLADGTDIDVELPLVANFESQPLLVKKKGNDAVDMRLVPQSGETIDGATSLTLASAYGAVEVFSDGVEWHLISGGNGSAGEIKNTTRVTTTYTVLATDEVIFCDTDSGAFTVTLPAGVLGTTYRIINVGSSSNNVTLTPDGTETINGASTETLFDGESLELTYETTEGWW